MACFLRGVSSSLCFVSDGCPAVGSPVQPPPPLAAVAIAHSTQTTLTHRGPCQQSGRAARRDCACVEGRRPTSAGAPAAAVSCGEGRAPSRPGPRPKTPTEGRSAAASDSAQQALRRGLPVLRQGGDWSCNACRRGTKSELLSPKLTACVPPGLALIYNSFRIHVLVPAS